MVSMFMAVKHINHFASIQFRRYFIIPVKQKNALVVLQLKAAMFMKGYFTLLHADSPILPDLP